MAKNAFQEAQDLFTRVYRSNIAPAGQRAQAFLGDVSKKIMDDEGYYQRGQFKPSQLPGLKQATQQVVDPYIQNRIVKPAQQAVSSFKQAVAPNQTIKQRGVSAGMGALNTLSSGFSFTPAAAMYSGVQGLYGGAQALRQGKNPKQILENARQTFTGQKYVGLGDAVTNNVGAAGILNTGDLVLGLMGRGLDDKLVRGATKALLGRRPAFHPEDAQYLDDALQAIKNKKISIEGKQQAIKIVDDLADRYLSKADIDKVGGKTSKLIKLLQKQSKAVSTYGQEGLQMGIYGGKQATGYKDAPNKFSSLADKKPRFEIDDTKAKLVDNNHFDLQDRRNKLSAEIGPLNVKWMTSKATPEELKKLDKLGEEAYRIDSLIEANKNPTLKDVLQHNDLFKQYPEFANTKIIYGKVDSLQGQGNFNPQTNTITISESLLRNNPQQAKSTLLHEIQHAVQEKEGFARGGNPEQFIPTYNEAKQITADKDLLVEMKRILPQYKKGDINKDKMIEDWYGKYPLRTLKRLEDRVANTTAKGQFSSYQRLAGEVEARDVQSRMDLSPKQRATTQPYASQGIPLKDQIVRFDGGVRESNSDTQGYLQELRKAQQAAKKGAETGFIQKVQDKMAQFKTGQIDEYSVIEDALSAAEKKGKFKVLPQNDIRINGFDKVLKSRDLASQFAKDNGIAEVIQQAPDLNALNQYLIAKQARDVADIGLRTGRDLKKDEQLIQDLAGEYEPLAQKVNQYSRNLLQYSVDSGLISKELGQELTQKYPHYVPLQRIFNDLEQASMPKGVGTKPIASLGSQSVVQKLKGSEREIANPIESILAKTQDAFAQGERNKTAAMLAKYKDLPGFEGLIKEAPDGAKHTFSYLENGVKKTFETTPEIEAAAKNLNQEQMSLLTKILNAPTRFLQLGATGLNIPFVVTNMLKDEITGFINSKNAAATSSLNPKVFFKSFLAAVRHDDLYDEVVRKAGMGTSFDISRQTPDLSVERIRAGKNIGSKIAYTATHPEELRRAIEDIVGRGEEYGRIKNYIGTKDALIKAGRNTQAAEILAAQAARETTANFARKGTWGRTLNYVIPFYNAGIQGSRQLVRSFQQNPDGTAAKMVVGLYMPVLAATAWNIDNPERKKVYEDISASEKENNIIIIPPTPTKDAKGRWNVIKIPIPPGLSNLAALVRRPVEAAQGLDPVTFKEMASNLVAASTSFDPSNPTKLMSSVLPQGMKIPSEILLNKNFYSGKELVPQYMLNKPVSEQVYDDTSGTSRIIGGALNTSPLKIDNAIRTTLGGLGSQIQNAADTALNKAGLIPDEQVGGEGAIANIQRRFSKSYGGEIQRRDDSKVTQYNSAKKEAIRAYLAGDKEKTKQLMAENKFKLTNGDIKTEIANQKRKALDAYLDGDTATAKKIRDQYSLKFTNQDVQNRAKSKAIALYKTYRATENPDYLAQVKALKIKYGFTIKNSDVQ